MRVVGAVLFLALVLAGCGDSPAGSAAPPPAVAAPPSAGTSTALVTEIHSVADLVRGGEASIDLAGPDGAGGTPSAEAAGSIAALVERLRTTAARDGWTDHASAVLKAQGDAIVVRGTRPFQQALASYLSGVRASLAPR
jgi:hypothetical protein